MAQSISSACRRLGTLLAAAALLFVVPTVGFAADDEDQESKLQVHGFLTQALATADYSDLGPTQDEIVMGIPDGDLTTDYRFLALQFRYQVSDKDVVVVQLSSRSLGDSPISEVEDEVELDWAFYERALGDQTAIKLGRIQIPFGIFNEIRDVGTVLPFYRPPFAFYREGTFTSETVDGILFHHTFGAASDWALSLDTYYGEYEVIEIPIEASQAPLIAQAEDVRGLQLWLSTPVFGLRLGTGAHWTDRSGGFEGIFRPVGTSTQFEDWYLSVDYEGGKFVGRAEYRENSADDFGGTPVIPFVAVPVNIAWYGQLGYFFNPKFGVFLQYEQSDVELDSPAFTQTAKNTAREDLGISLNYRFNPRVVLKLEHHEVDQELGPGFNPVFVPGGVLLDPFNVTSDGGTYTILTFATSF